jgi:hypothetical protein
MRTTEKRKMMNGDERETNSIEEDEAPSERAEKRVASIEEGRGTQNGLKIERRERERGKRRPPPMMCRRGRGGSDWSGVK